MHINPMPTRCQSIANQMQSQYNLNAKEMFLLLRTQHVDIGNRAKNAKERLIDRKTYISFVVLLIVSSYLMFSHQADFGDIEIDKQNYKPNQNIECKEYTVGPCLF